MTIKELYAGLIGLGYPVAYSHFSEGNVPDPPFITYFCSGTNNFSADGIAYCKIDEFDIELYSRNKDLDAEKKIEDWLTQKDLFYEKTEYYIESEKMIQVIFEISI